MQDIFSQYYERYIQWAGHVSDISLITLMRITLLFAVPTAICYWTFITHRREGGGRFIASFLADCLVLGLPIRVPSDVTARAWILTICILLSLYLPGALPFLIFKEAGRQRRLRTALYWLLLVLLIVGMIWS